MPATKLFVDDLRNPYGDGWKVARTFEEATQVLLNEEVEIVSLDHDLGEDTKTGYDLVKWMVENLPFWPTVVIIHTSNPVGRDNMSACIKRYAPKCTLLLHNYTADARYPIMREEGEGRWVQQ